MSLFEAVLEGDLKRVEALLAGGADPNPFDAERRTPLMLAAEQGAEHHHAGAPEQGAEQVPRQERAVGVPRAARGERHERAHHGHEPAEHEGAAAVALEEPLGAAQVGRLQDAGVVLEEAGARLVADQVARLVAEGRGGEADECHDGQRQADLDIASENVAKDEVVAELLERYSDQRVIVIGQYLAQLRGISERFDIPLITGSTGQAEREELYGRFRRGEVRHLVLSKVGNFAIDLPDANVLIQVSGTFGSRQEEAQRLGRVLRPKSDGRTAHFYTVVTRDTVDAEFAAHRQRFLAEQGYAYRILDAEEVPDALVTGD